MHNWKGDTKEDNDPIKIDWSKIHAQYNYVAMDKNGLWCAYIDEPVIDIYRSNRWECQKSQFDYTGLGYFCSQASCISFPPKLNWKETLRKRPSIKCTESNSDTHYINWELIDATVNYASMDKDGSWWGFEDKPNIQGYKWCSDLGYMVALTVARRSKTASVDWTKTLCKRP